jgi:hypothetical protein
LVDKHYKFCRLRHTPDIWWISQYHHVKSLALTNMWGKWWHSPTRRHVFWWCLVSSPRRLATTSSMFPPFCGQIHIHGCHVHDVWLFHLYPFKMSLITQSGCYS